MRARLLTALLALLWLLPCSLAWSAPASAAPPASVGGTPRRLALIIGANAAAPGRKDLRFSRHDAESVGQVLVELGGFAREDVSVLLDPDPSVVLAALDAQFAKLRASGQEALLFFYYSGHADANALYPNGRALPLADLRERMKDPRVGVRIGIIDACRGGGWTGAKGLTETAPFEVDLPSALSSEGSVLIASSSGLEDAHESELLGGSFFTHHWIAALRGAADRNADGQVMLTEAFEYARALTIRDTALHTVTPQHPSFSMQLRGRHDLALSTLAGANALIAVSQQEGPIELVHLGSGVVVLELPKGPRAVRLAVAPGRYVLRRRSGDRAWAREIEVRSGQTVDIQESQLTPVGSVALATKDASPLPLTLTTLPKGKQEITGWLGVTHGSAFGFNLQAGDQFQFGMVAPRGLTDRWQWILPQLAFAYRGGEHGGFEWIPWGGVLGWGFGFSSLQGFVLDADVGLGLDLRYWFSPRGSFDFGLGAASPLRWTSRDPDEFFVDPMRADGQPSMYKDIPQWIPPTTWRAGLSLGFTYTLHDAVTFHLAAGLWENQWVSGDVTKHPWSSEGAALALGFGAVQSIGLRPQPLLRVHVRDWFALNLSAAVHYFPALRRTEDSYLGGASFVW